MHFEAANILLAIQIWFKKWRDATVTVWCNNGAVVNAFTSQKI